MKELQKDRIERVGQDILVRLYPEELVWEKGCYVAQFVFNGQRVVFRAKHLESVEVDNAIEVDFTLLFKVVSDEKDKDILYILLEQIPVYLESYNFGCVYISNVRARYNNETFHLGYIKTKTENPKHDLDIKGDKAICKNCGFELKIIGKTIKELDEQYHEISYILENSQVLKIRESHNKECFGRCLAQETQELLNILKDVKIIGNTLVHPEFEVALNPKVSSSLEFNSLEDYYYIEERVSYRPILIKGNSDLYYKMKDLIRKLKNILAHSEYSHYAKIFSQFI